MLARQAREQLDLLATYGAVHSDKKGLTARIKELSEAANDG